MTGSITSNEVILPLMKVLKIKLLAELVSYLNSTLCHQLIMCSFISVKVLVIVF